MATNAYAPYSPQVLGDSWVPIKEDPMSLSLSQEHGYWFNLSASSTVVTARVYPGLDMNPAAGESIPYVNIYPESTIDEFGPIGQVVVPVNSITAGADTTLSAFGVPNAIGVLSNPNGDGSVGATDNVSGSASFSIGFDVSAASTILTGRRILEVELLYLLRWTELGSANVNGTYSVSTFVSSSTSATDTIGNLATSYIASTSDGSNTSVTPPAQQLPRTALFHGTVTTNTNGDRYPWNYTNLSRFDSTITSAAQRLQILFQLSSTEGTLAGDRMVAQYFALRVTYCNETRVGVGARQTLGTAASTQPNWGPESTTFSIPVLDIAQSAAPVLAAGNYYVTVGEANTLPFDPMRIKQLRQLYEQDIPGIRGVIIPYNQFADLTLEGVASDLIPTITLHTSSAVVNDSHGYTDQLIAPVYAGVVARQGVLNLAATSTSYNLARFYARRIGTTTSPLGLRLQSTPTTSAEISVEDFDALDEITDGWKEVNLEFTSSIPVFTAAGTATSMEFFSSTPSGARWEVLGARSTIVSGFANTVEIGPNHWGAPTTYGGTTAVATWDQGSGSPTIDFRGDLTLMMASMPQVTGLTIEENLLEVAVTDECDQAPGAIPTGVYYNTLSWSGASGGVIGDTFDRAVVSGGWGTSTSGSVWDVTQGSSSVWSTDATTGVIDPAATSTSYMNITNTSMLNAEIEATVTPTALVSTQSNIYLVARYFDTSNWYSARFAFNTDGSVQVGLEKNVAGVTTTVVAVTSNGTTYAAGQGVKVKFRVMDSVLMAKSWNIETPEPPKWTAVATDTSLTTAGRVGMRAFVGDAAVTYNVDDFTAQWGFGGFELQRQDRWTDWQTIMLATSPLVASFNDFEARVGVESEYRIRACQLLDFCGTWSSTVANTIPTPGVTGTNVDSSLLIFTSNARQDGADTLAYSEIFDGTPSQTFAFLESAGITMQPMYLRDYQVAYHGTERGGESFSRTLLFNNAAVSLANFESAFQSLRDLAWDSVPYICVRDEHGSRWLANVAVGSGTIQPPGNSLWFTEVAITEVTATAYPVNPS